MRLLALLIVLSVPPAALSAQTAEARAEGLVSVTAYSNRGLGTVTVVVDGVPLPARVVDLEVVEATETTVTLAWTEVDDGLGGVPSYAVRYATPTISWNEAADVQQVVPGASVGARMEYTVSGLEPGTEYQFQLAAFREG